MKTYKSLLIGGLLGLMSQTALAQKAGDMVTGNVSDDIEGLMMANVTEVDASNRIVSHTSTDINGNFSFRIKNPKNKIRVSYSGYQTVTIPINGFKYNIRLKSIATIKEVVVKAKKVTPAMSGLPIPERELSMASHRLDMKDFEGLAMTSVDEALQGQIAGLDIIANSGDLGAGSTMRLRGVSSINGSSEPLIVVNGNPFKHESTNFDYTNSSNEQYAELLNVNPNDIESITVIKDAAGTAIWGAEGANGVIEIKTKRGQKGKTRFSYAYSATLTNQPKGMRMLDGDHYTMLMKEAYFNPRLNDAASDILEFNYDPSFSEYEQYNNNTDWNKAVDKLGLQQQHTVTLNGGGEKANFHISATYDHQTGSVIAQKLQRFSTRVALDYYISDRITAITNFDMTYTKNHKNMDGLKEIAYKKMPNLSIYEQDENGNDTDRYYHLIGYSSGLKDQFDLVNPVASAYEALKNESTYKITPEFIFRYKLLGTDSERHRLDYEGKIYFDIFNRTEDSFRPSSLVGAGWGTKESNKATNSTGKSTNINTEHRLTFYPHFNNKDHSLMLMAKFRLNSSTSKDQSSTIYDLPYSTIINTGADGIVDAISYGTGRGRSILMNLVGHYSYKERYIADFTLTRNGNTKFGDDRRWGTFPAISGKWIISDEPWLKEIKWLENLAIRPGWGIAGNAPGGEGFFYSKYGTGSKYGSATSTYQKNVRLNNIQWEKTESFNFGIDYGFFKNKINGYVEIYSRNTTRMIMNNRQITSSSGFDHFDMQNLGSMRNNGWELYFKGENVIKKGKFSATFDFNLGNNRNVITSMDPTVLANMNGEFNRQNGSYLSRVQLNNPFGSIYGFRYKGVYQYSKYSEVEVPGISGPNAPVARDAEGNVIVDKYGLTVPMVFCYDNKNQSYIYEFKGGDAIYEDINHDGQINELDIVYLGSSLPKMNGGFSIRLNYGRFSWNSHLNFRFGNKIVNGARMNAESMYGNNNQSTAVNWRWRVEGDIAPIPRALHQSGYNYLGSDRFVEPGAFLRLGYTQFRYSFDPKKLKSYGINNLSLSLNMNNLFCLTKYSGCEPEVSPGRGNVAMDNAKTPRSRTYTLRLDVQF